MTSQEILRQAFPDKSTPLISYGLPFTEACVKHVNGTFKASRVYLIASASLTKDTTHTFDLQKVLASRLVKTRVGMTPHTLISEVLEIVQECRDMEIDCIVTLGGGSLIDGAKIASFALANNVQTQADLMTLPRLGPHTANLPALPSKIPIICIPTTLSGGQYTVFSGVTNNITHEKVQFSSPLASPSLIILSGPLACSTPLEIWLQSGMRGVDHCIETLSSLKSTDEVDQSVLNSLKCLIPGLLLSAKGQANGGEGEEKARLECQIGVSYAMLFLHRRVACGASHGIGHMLGPMGKMNHGQTSCILLPAVCKFNAKHSTSNPEVLERQKVIEDTLWGIAEARNLFERMGLSKEESDLGDLIEAVVKGLGLKSRLREVGVGKETFESLAEASLRDPFLVTNCIPISKKEEVLEILEMCA
ncbi:iron-containing alcohol dehydrogenase-like protein [Hyaloscypha hepaticicola]|uniref:Iron-containing alcohol dehydrogenase-like protein n=1 Tax=Hyaloscypha hepaticicola TaxID=2082293 RepID=A0A2J6PZ57_9HELO|nr:iron-containing alcohol dehydrogenase-like protein [Hyaloscypha hepaticicola]